MVLGGNNCSSDWDRNIIRPNCCLTLIRSVMYWGASPWIALNAKIRDLNSVLKQTGNQCKENKVRVIWQKRERDKQVGQHCSEHVVTCWDMRLVNHTANHCNNQYVRWWMHERVFVWSLVKDHHPTASSKCYPIPTFFFKLTKIISCLSVSADNYSKKGVCFH